MKAAEQLRMLRQLAGTERPAHITAEQVAEAADVLATATRAWRLHLPHRDTIDRAIAQADAVARALRELRQQQGGQ